MIQDLTLTRTVTIKNTKYNKHCEKWRKWNSIHCWEDVNSIVMMEKNMEIPPKQNTELVHNQ